jgi:hypothetical protein
LYFIFEIFYFGKQTGYANKIEKQVLPFEKIEENIRQKSIQVAEGGKSFTEINSKCERPPDALQNLAIIVPYRNREDNLKVFLNNMLPFWTRQKVNYGVYLIEPADGTKFNRALLMNIGFVESQKDKIDQFNATHIPPVNITENFPGTANQSTSPVTLNWNCWIFHDVDM